MSETEVAASLTYSIKKDGEIVVDLSIDDFSEKAIEGLATLLSSISTIDFQIQTVALIEEAFLSQGKGLEFEFFAADMIQKATENIEKERGLLDEGGGRKEVPIIKPTDLL